MYCSNEKNVNCGCKYNIKSLGQCDVTQIKINGSDRTSLNWNEISVPEVMEVPIQKPDIEHLDQVHVKALIQNVKLIQTPYAYNSYPKISTAYEITTVSGAAKLSGAIDLARIVTAVTTLLAVPGLPAIPEVAAVTEALKEVTAADTRLKTTVTEELAILGGTCVTGEDLIKVIQSDQAALNTLSWVIQTLSDTVNALAVATAAIPVVGPLVATAVTAAVTVILAVVTDITAALTVHTDSLTLIGAASVLVLKPNAEGTCLSGRKLVLEGILEQKVVYTALVDVQSVHSMCKTVSFSAYIIPYASFTGLTFTKNVTVLLDPDKCKTGTVNGFPYNPAIPLEIDLCEEFEVNVCVEDVFAYDIDARNVFKNVTLFLSAKPAKTCQ